MKTNDSILTPPGPDLAERRFVYSGEPPTSTPENSPRGNKRVKQRKRSPFNIVAIVFVASILIVLYVWNKITVNGLAVQVNDLRMQYEKVLNANDVLRATISKKSSLERLGKIATERLGLIYPKEQPVWFNVNADETTR